jgi:hypothetical protein
MLKHWVRKNLNAEVCLLTKTSAGTWQQRSRGENNAHAAVFKKKMLPKLLGVVQLYRSIIVTVLCYEWFFKNREFFFFLSFYFFPRPLLGWMTFIIINGGSPPAWISAASFHRRCSALRRNVVGR